MESKSHPDSVQKFIEKIEGDLKKKGIGGLARINVKMVIQDYLPDFLQEEREKGRNEAVDYLVIKEIWNMGRTPAIELLKEARNPSSGD